MDTALFYLSYLGLSPRTAAARLRQMADNVVQFGGCLTVNWHDRSIAPGRLWDACYRGLVRDMKRRGAWFSTAGQAISWFRKRRSAVFETDSIEPGAVRAKVAVERSKDLPGLRLRIYKARASAGFGPRGSGDYIDLAVNENVDAVASSEAR